MVSYFLVFIYFFWKNEKDDKCNPYNFSFKMTKHYCIVLYTKVGLKIFLRLRFENSKNVSVCDDSMINKAAINFINVPLR